jgi:hypothetical protein
MEILHVFTPSFPQKSLILILRRMALNVPNTVEPARSLERIQV